MSVTLKNIGSLANRSGIDTKALGAVQGDQGTVRVIYEGIEYVFGPNDSKTFSDEGIAAALQAQDARLQYAGQPDGVAAYANASLSYIRY